MPATKQCSKCGHDWPATRDNFRPRATTRDGLNGRCKPCEAKSRKRWDLEHPERKHTCELARRFGITRAKYDEMFAAQRGVCAICLKHERYRHNGKPRRLAVDHDHETGAVRELLCTDCNHALGLLGDDPTILLRAADYLIRHGKAVG
jgi:hypothetical protein